MVTVLTTKPKTLEGICANTSPRICGIYSQRRLSATVITMLKKAAFPVTNLECNPNIMGMKAETP